MVRIAEVSWRLPECRKPTLQRSDKDRFAGAIWSLLMPAAGWVIAGMNELLVGYARESRVQQDPTTDRDGLHALGVGDDRICVDHGSLARTGFPSSRLYPDHRPPGAWEPPGAAQNS